MRPPARRFLPLVLATALVLPGSLAAQGSGAGTGVRMGITFGGISTVGVNIEYFDGTRSLELTFGTWTFRDLSVSAVVKEYFGAGSLHPFVGAGLWAVAAKPPGERLGTALVLRAPVGADWRVAGRHYLGLSLNVNRALWVRRTDPEDDLPLNERLVLLPEAYYRWTW